MLHITGSLKPILIRSGAALYVSRSSQIREGNWLQSETSYQKALAMQYQVFVQNPSEQHFIASVVNLPGVTAEGQTKEEAIAKAKEMLERQLSLGEFVTIEVESQPSALGDDPWIKHIGIFADDPTFDDFLAEIAAYCQQVYAQAPEE